MSDSSWRVCKVARGAGSATGGAGKNHAAPGVCIDGLPEQRARSATKEWER